MQLLYLLQLKFSITPVEYRRIFIAEVSMGIMSETSSVQRNGKTNLS